jgi:gluconolactonase
MRNLFLMFAVLALATACRPDRKPATEAAPDTAYPVAGSIDRLDPALEAIIPAGAQLEILGEGYEWSEGPVWVESRQFLLFSDIPPNKVYKWSEEEGITLYLHPAGYTGPAGRGGEGGSNGLLIDPEGRLVLCQHGDRRMAYMNAPLDAPASEFVTLADAYDGRRLNSPNDAVYKSDGQLYFTDPPYGLEKGEDDPLKEIPFQGVYRLRLDGTVELLTNELSRPNGIGFSPDEKTLYVANSDPEKALWMAYEVLEDGSLGQGRVFYDATSLVGTEKGLPDGLAVDAQGHVFATGPGGVWVFDAGGKTLGLIRTGQATANCTFGNGGAVLYITADMYLMRLVLKPSSLAVLH